jgi:hypothetical protein
MPESKIPSAIAVRATSVTDPTNVRRFASLYAAKSALEKEFGIKVHHERIRKDATANKEAHGFKWELEHAPEPEQIVSENAGGPDDGYVFTFRENVEAIFAGGKVRVTDETPKRASVFDVISVVTAVKNPRDVLRELCTKYKDFVDFSDNIYTFKGIGQRPTPVCTAQQFMMLVNVLPGHRAALFRISGADVLVRYLAGDQTLHAEIDENAERQASLPDTHPMRMMTEALQQKPINKACEFLSPNMTDKHIGKYNKKPLVYLLYFEYKGAGYAKVGHTRDIIERMKKHVKELPGCQLYTVVLSDDAEAMEQEFKEQFTINRMHVTVGGKVQTELFTGMEMSEFEAGLHDIEATMTESKKPQPVQPVDPMQIVQQIYNRAFDLVESGQLSKDNKCFESIVEMYRLTAAKSLAS